jgi:hypothetical protein
MATVPSERCQGEYGHQAHSTFDGISTTPPLDRCESASGPENLQFLPENCDLSFGLQESDLR